MPLQHPDRPAVGSVPEPDRLVHRGRGDPRAVGAEGQPADLIFVPGRSRQRRPVLRIPEADGAIREIAAGGEDLAVRSIGQRMDSRRMAAQGGDERARARASQIRATESRPMEASRRPSGLKATARTMSVWPRRTARASPVARSQIRAVRSSEAEARSRPSGEKATERAAAVCPRRARIGSRVSPSQTRTRPSCPAEARYRPPGPKSTCHTAMSCPRARAIGARSGRPTGPASRRRTPRPRDGRRG